MNLVPFHVVVAGPAGDSDFMPNVRTSGPSQADCWSAASVQFDDSFLSLSSGQTATADYGYLHFEYGTNVAVEVGPSAPPGLNIDWEISAYRSAKFEDIITLISVPENARLQARAYAWVEDNDAFQNVDYWIGSIERHSRDQVAGENRYADDEVIDIPFTTQVPIGIAVMITGSSYRDRWQGDGYSFALARLAFQVVDQQGTVVNNFTYWTRSGAAYGLTGTFAAIPEPESAWLVTVGLGIGSVLIRRKPSQ